MWYENETRFLSIFQSRIEELGKDLVAVSPDPSREMLETEETDAARNQASLAPSVHDGESDVMLDSMQVGLKDETEIESSVKLLQYANGKEENNLSDEEPPLMVEGEEDTPVGQDYHFLPVKKERVSER